MCQWRRRLTHQYAIDDLVPHRVGMSFLDEVVDSDAESLHAIATIRASNPFLRNGGVSSALGIEYMAQAIAAWAGVKAQIDNEPIKLGFLVGSRDYSTTLASFPLHARLDIFITRIVQADIGLGVFECRIETLGESISANINVYQPDDVALFLQEANV
jgi:predicted hotdog family 3-hydroxylacyl-ACP dehydratase